MELHYKWVVVSSHCLERTDRRVFAMARGLRCLGFPGSSHRVVELAPRDQVPPIRIAATSDSRSSGHLG
jgi:hypothetical protein